MQLISSFQPPGYYYIGILVLLFFSTTETILVTKLVAANSDLQLKQDFKGATATPVLDKVNDHPEDKKPRMNGKLNEKQKNTHNCDISEQLAGYVGL